MSKLIIAIAALALINTACKTRTADAPFGDHYNVSWNTQSENSSESMPLVGGDIACNVWVEEGEVLFYLSRSGSFDEHGAYLKLGRVRIKLTPNPFDDAGSFRQELILQDGFVEIEGKADKIALNVKIKLWVEVKNPVVHVDVNASSPLKVEAIYESWRTEERELAPGNYGERFASFNLMAYPGKLVRSKDDISFTDRGILFYHRNPEEKLSPELLIRMQGLEEEADGITDDLKNRTFGGLLFGEDFVQSGRGSGDYMNTSFQSWKLVSREPRKTHRLFIATHIAQAESVEDWEKPLLDLVEEAANNHENASRETTAWWNDFWKRSWITVSPGSCDTGSTAWQMARNYQLFRYQLGGNVSGEYPTKFNGGSLTFDPILVSEESDYGPDWRKWGGNVFTAQNQRLVYWPMLKSGDFDAILPQFELYRKGLPGARARVKTHFGHEGALYCEYTSVPGIPFGDGWGWKGGSSHRQRGEEIPFGDPRADALKGFGDPVEKGVMANPAIAYHWESQVEHAYMILEYHRFTGADISQYMPFIKQSLIFFDEHYRMRQKIRNGSELDEQGKLVLFPSTSCESYRGAKNPSDLIAGLQACIEALLELDGQYMSNAEKDYYRDFYSHIPDLVYGEEMGDKILKPAESWGRYQNSECPQFYPLFPFNRFSLAEDDMTVFKNTWKHGSFRKGNVVSWHQDGIFFARMGMTEEAADFNTRKLEDSPRRFPTFWGPGHDWVPDHNWGGSGMIGLQEMLMQTIGDKILLLPAWPEEWDVDFKLHAPMNTTVECHFENGEITSLVVTPESRANDVLLPDTN
ncbi:MAG TPA: hypothetical protein ENI20_15435 [Bacteroides sp.]|nr:hypothetical protein [Bacteroides sp.]